MAVRPRRCEQRGGPIVKAFAVRGPRASGTQVTSAKENLKCLLGKNHRL